MLSTLRNICILLCSASVTAAQSHLLSPAAIYRHVVNSTVTIVTDAETFGSGFYVAPNVVATNYHVVEGATKAKCMLTNTTTEVNVTGYVAIDKNADLILLKVTGKPKTPLKLAHGKVTTGQVIYAVGAPQGMEGTISDGIVSAVRTLKKLKLIQITAPISRGSSGGPIVNRLGEVMGIATLSHSSGQNLNFAVSYTHLQTLMGRMKATPTPLVRLARQHSSQASSANTEPARSKVLKLRTTAVAARHKTSESRWGDWSDWEDASILITLDPGIERIIIYSQQRQVYDIAENDGDSTDKDGNETLSLRCIDDDGVSCTVRLVSRQEGQLQLYVDYSNASWVYNVYALD